MRNRVKLGRLEYSSYDIDDMSMANLLEAVKTEFGDDLENITISVDTGEYSCEISFEHFRDETDEEMRQREQNEVARHEAYVKEQEAKDRAALAKLKAKYEND